MKSCLLLLSVLILLVTSVGDVSALDLASASELYTGAEYRKAFANPDDDPKLPNVLLIGDSISIGYTIGVRKHLAGKADVFRIPTNGQTAQYGIENLDKWIGQREWDVIHFNWGLWDICYRNPEAKTQGHRDKVHGTLSVTPDQYREALVQAVAKLKATDAKLIWCATTPVPTREIGRNVGDEVKYNSIAESIMEENEIQINDLHSYALKGLPEIQARKGDVHFTSKGYAYLAEQVAREIAAALPAVEKPQ
ncbi:hypothetical protein SAMN06265222_12541 [Neorhodopirellula lusitana]|uniref:SGNH/GDSL hydrolase family protein n=1 Tax=Neorhodopirellula lusitana TaxID=445327 RepID=A0ABY1QUL2_9BACT|nr:SGNH/GDSL hydrolase family protein [Neorhodopirellula lusitana]SMP78306.1 hypothetical protein SAMN06265222_12541 [Neorhodopirellula lusitana]